jgi:hypothetical protein
MNVSTNGTPTDVLDLADVAPSSITSAMVANGNTIELFNGSTMIDHFALAAPWAWLRCTGFQTVQPAATSF